MLIFNEPNEPKPWANVHAELGFNPPAFDDRPLGQLIEHQAATRPDGRAFIYFNRIFTYRDYDLETGKLANALANLGIKRGDVVGLHMPNIPQYCIALGALSRLGAIGSGVSPLLTPQEIAFQLADAKINAVISLSDIAARFSDIKERPETFRHLIVTSARDYLDAPAFDLPEASGVSISRWLELIADAPAEFTSVDWHWNDTAMIQYTGGTTGRPKGAELTVRNLMYNVLQQCGPDGQWHHGEEVIGSAFPYFHIAGLALFIVGVYHGSFQMVLPDPRDTDLFCDQMAAFAPTRIAGVPALLEMLLANPKFSKVDFSRLVSVKTGAAPIASSTRDALIEVIGDNKICDVFGMTETSPVYVIHPPSRYKPGSIGVPVPGSEVRIMDIETGTKIMPAGEPGEIISTGPQTMKGYLNLPEETDHALREMDGMRWMYSGDVGYMDDEGYIYLCDRAKDMLVVGGYKVFSVEVEDKLKSLDVIENCAVVATPDVDRPGNDIVNLFVERTSDASAMSEPEIETTIFEFCRENFAPYKMPKRIHFIDVIPLTPVGKIDKKAMRAMAE